MQIEVLFSKIHRAIVTNSELEYEGSIFIDQNMRAAQKWIDQLACDGYDARVVAIDDY